MYPRNQDAEKTLKLSSRGAPKLCEIKHSTTRHKYITSVAMQKTIVQSTQLTKKKNTSKRKRYTLGEDRCHVTITRRIAIYGCV